MKKTTLAVLALLLAGAMPGAADAKGKDVAPGQLIKGTSTSSVYYIDEDLTRHAFPNEHVFKSWYKDFSGVVVTDDETLSQYPLAGLVPYKAATRLVKVQSDPKVYAVDDGGELRWVKNERVAKALYGDDWADKIDDLADSFFANYLVGDDIEDDEDFNEQLHLLIKDITETLRTKRVKRLEHRGADSEEFEHRGYGHDKVALCHSFDGRAHTIYVASPAKSAHLAHGDQEGECADDDGDDEESDVTAPVISDAAINDVTSDGAVVEFTTNEDTTAVVYYSASSPVDLDTAENVTSVTGGTTHSVALAGLLDSTLYYVVIRVEDGSGNVTTADERTFTTDAPDTTNPTVSLLEVNDVGETTATVHFEADEEVTATVYYSTTSPVDTGSAASVTSAELASAHDVALSGLVAGTTYYVWVEVEDGSGNAGTAGEQDFTTMTPDVTAPTVDPLTIGTPTDSTVTISLTADEEVTATAYYSLTSPVDTGTADHVAGGSLSTTQEIGLTGLAEGATYYVIIEVEDASGNTWTSDELDFTTEVAV